MPRLIDDLRAQGRVMMPWYIEPTNRQQWCEYAARVSEVLSDPDLPVLLIDNVADYFYSGTDQEYWSLDKDFPNVAPPFPRFWCEFKLVNTIRSTKGNTDVSEWLPQGGRAGQLFVALRPEEVKGEGIPENAKWIYWLELFVDFHRRDVNADGPHGATFLCVDAAGAVIGNPWMLSYAAAGTEEIMKNMMAWYNPSFLAISFLHCKNVTLVDNVVDKPLAKKWASKHGGLQPTGYKTLIIEPLKAILRREGRAHETGLQKAMHICRGHFADYTEGRGLFGKYHGKFWIPSVVRGSKGKAAPPREIKVKVGKE